MTNSRNIFKSILHGLFIFLLSLATFTGITLITLALTMTDRQTVKSWPAEAGVYDDITVSFLDLAAHAPANNDSGDNELNQMLNSETLNSNKIKLAVASVYTPRYWQTKYDTVIDSTYDWLEGSQPELKFELDFGDKIDEAAGAISAEVANQLASLSTCTTNQLPSQFDVLNAKCLPPGVSATQAANQLERSINAKDGLGGQDLRISTDNSDISLETRQSIQQAYQFAIQAPTIMVIVILLLIGLVAVTGRSWLHGLRRAGQVIISAGIVSWISFFFLTKITDLIPEVKDDSAQQIVKNVALPFINAVLTSISNIGLWVALTAIITGILLWLGGYIWHKVHHHSEAEKIAKRAMGGSAPKPTNSTLPPPVDPKPKS